MVIWMLIKDYNFKLKNNLNYQETIHTIYTFQNEL